MLSYWYRITRVWRILSCFQATNSDVYCQQLMKLEEAIKREKAGQCWQISKESCSTTDNAKPHTFLATRIKLLELGWKVMSHSPYSPDFAPSNYHLFRNLQNFLNGKNFSNNDDLKSHLVEFFADEGQKFYERGIMKLPERWQKVIEQE